MIDQVDIVRVNNETSTTTPFRIQQRPSVSLFEYFEIPFEIFKKHKLLNL